MYLWSGFGGLSEYLFSPIVVIISAASMIVAALSYTVIPEKIYLARVISALIAYALLLTAVGLQTVMTGTSDSPFLALWMVASVFCGMFGMWVVGVLLVGLTGYTVWAYMENDLSTGLMLGIALAGYLPLIISYVLWHSKSSTEKNKEQAYFDLANQLNQVANKSDTVISAISDGVIAINNQGNIELINPAALRLTGWGKQDAVHLDYKSVLQLLARDGSVLDKSKDPIFEVLTTNQPVRRDDLQLQTNAGKKMSIEVVVSPIGRIGEGAIIVFRDITKEQAEEKEQAEFISTASHEMRTPVASIEGYLGLALNPATAKIDDKARDFITKAHEAAQHLGRLFQDLLDITKAEDGRLQNNPKVIDIVQFTHDIVEGLKPKADEKQLRLFFKPMTQEAGGLKNLEPVYFVNVDADHLREVTANLVENAIKYTPKGEVVIDVKGDNAHVVVSIADSGIGIPSEDIPHLFQKFYRVDNTDTREIGGTGLGLYLCRRLVDAMEGRIWVESEYKKGSTFFVELPRISHEDAQRLIEVASVEKVKPAANKTIEEREQDVATAKRHQEALSIPIIKMRKGSASQAQPYKTPVATKPEPPKVPQNAADAVLGGNAGGQQEPLRPHNEMVIPASIKDMPSNLQKAQVPAPATTRPAVAPAPARPVATPAPTRPATPPAQPASAPPVAKPEQPSAPNPRVIQPLSQNIPAPAIAVANALQPPAAAPVAPAPVAAPASAPPAPVAPFTPPVANQPQPAPVPAVAPTAPAAPVASVAPPPAPAPIPTPVVPEPIMPPVMTEPEGPTAPVLEEGEPKPVPKQAPPLSAPPPQAVPPAPDQLAH